jgi:hypothetical protein
MTYPYSQRKYNVRTSVLGLGTILVAVAGALVALTDSDPATVPEWDTVIAAITAGVGLLFARDAKVTSEQAGAK